MTEPQNGPRRIKIRYRAKNSKDPIKFLKDIKKQFPDVQEIDLDCEEIVNEPLETVAREVAQQTVDEIESRLQADAETKASSNPAQPAVIQKKSFRQRVSELKWWTLGKLFPWLSREGIQASAQVLSVSADVDQLAQ